MRFAAADLRADRVHRPFVVQQAIGVGVIADEGIHFDHFAEDQAWAVFGGHAPKRQVRAASEGGAKNIGRERDVSELKRAFHRSMKEID